MGEQKPLVLESLIKALTNRERKWLKRYSSIHHGGRNRYLAYPRVYQTWNFGTWKDG